MPKREDEFWAGTKEPKGRGLCPFCGSSNIYYNKRYESWKCSKCEKSFPSPSYGPGGDFGKEARWFGKTTEEMRRKEFAEAAKKKKESVRAEHKNEAVSSGKAWFGSEYYDRKSKRWRRSGRGRMSWTVLPIFVLFITSVVILYYLFSNFEQFDRAVAIGIVSAAVVMTIWLVATLRRLWRFRPRGVGLGRILLSLILLALIGCTVGAYAGVAPLADAKDRVVGFLGDLSLGISSELKTTIMGFEARRQPPDISEVVFMVVVDPTDNAVKWTEYTVELLIEGRVSDSAKVLVTESGSVTPLDIYLKGHGRVMNKMLSELDERYKAAKSEYDSFQEKMAWDFMTGRLGRLSYEQMKDLENKEAKLEAEVNKWQAWRNGGSLGYYDEFDRFCRQYVQLRIVRERDN